MNELSHNIAESEVISGVALCINDFNYDKKEVLITHTQNLALLEFIASFNVNVHYVGDLKAQNVHTYSLALELKTNKFDVIIDLDNQTTAPYKQLLKDGGIVIINLKSLQKDIIAESNFNIKMPFRIENKFYLFLSDRFHPIADFSIQKMDLIDDLKYYNEGIHRAAFALPNYQKKLLLGVVRN